MAKVLYKQGTKATYLNLPERVSTALYFCTDTHELYRGNDLYTDGIRKVANFALLPEPIAAADGKLYFCEDSGCGYILNDERNGWTQVIFGVDNKTVEVGTDGLLRVKAIPISSVSGLDDKLAEIEQKIICGGGQVSIATQDSVGIVKGSSEISIAEDGAMSITGVDADRVNFGKEKLDAVLTHIADAIVWKDMDSSNV